MVGRTSECEIFRFSYSVLRRLDQWCQVVSESLAALPYWCEMGTGYPDLHCQLSTVSSRLLGRWLSSNANGFPAANSITVRTILAIFTVCASF